MTSLQDRHATAVDTSTGLDPDLESRLAHPDEASDQRVAS